MLNVRLLRAILFLLALLLILSQTGCSVFSTLGGWISQGYDNTVSYFNAYYNAKTLFDEAEAEVLAAKSSMKTKPATAFSHYGNDPGTFGSQGTPGFPSTGLQQPPGFQTQPGSQSQPGFSNSPGFPQANAQQAFQAPVPQQPLASSSAKQKFAQVIDKCSNILSFYPKSSVVDDALFLIGKSYFYQDEFVRAERKFTELIVQDPNGPLALESQLWLLKTLQRLYRYDDANHVGGELVDAATKAEENEIAGEALEILGDVAMAQKKPDAAIEFYTKAVAIADDGPIRAAAQSRIGDIYVAAEQYEKAAGAYTDVSKYSPDAYGLYTSQVQAAMAYRRISRYDTATDILRKLETDYRFMDFLGTIRSELASTFAADHRYDEAIDLYRLVDTTYARTEQGARAAFELGRLLQVQMGDYAEAKVAFAHATVGGPADLTTEAQRRSTALDKYIRLSDQFVKLDSMYFIIDIDSLWMKIDSSSVFATRARRDSLTALARRDSPEALPDNVGRRRQRAVSAPPADSVSHETRVDTAMDEPTQLPVVLMKPRKDSLLASLSTISYQLGELFYTDLDVPDSTFYWLNQARKLGLDSAKSVRSLFVLAEVARAHPEKKYGDEKELYRQIIDKYPKSTYAEEARIALGFPPTPRKVDPALIAFALAESLMVAENYPGAIDSLRGILRDFPESPVAAKSRYTMAWIYENNLSDPDSALAQYKALAARNANTKYGAAALRRIPPDTARPAPAAAPGNTAVDSVGKRPGILPEKAPSDSLMKSQQKNQAPPDSLFRKPEFDERPIIRGVGKDSVVGHKLK